MPWTDTAITNTLALGIAATCIAVPLGLVMAAVARRRGLVGRLVLIAMIGLLFFPLFLHVSLWDSAFGKLGWLTSTRGQVLTPLVSGWTAAAWIHGAAATPQVALIFLVGLATGRRAHEEQATLDAGYWQALIHVKLRRLLPLIALSILWVMVACSREIAVTDIYRIETLAEQIYLGYSLGQLGSVAGTWAPEQLSAAIEFEIGNSLLPFFGITLAFATGFVRLAGPVNSLDESQANRPRRPTFLHTTAGAVLLAVLVVVPFLNVLVRCGYGVKPVDGVAVAGFSWQQVSDSLTRACTDFGYEFFWSTTIAATAATGIVGFSMVIAWLARDHWGWRATLIGLLAVSLAVPGPLTGTAIAQAFSDVTHPWLVWAYDRTIFAPALATMFFFWPLCGMLVWYLFSRVDGQTIESAKLEGAGAFDRLWHLGVRGNLLPLWGCWLMTFALCFGELSASQLILPPGMDTLPRLMLGLLHAGVDEMTAALAVVIGAATVTMGSVACLIFHRSADWR